ncbi:hypothetical protein EZY14_009300 [Kordia sp. TARA_039_SRF]|nr:hypothetical protein EZY14_009300 [Kordia sp. TARA_039_SRF]
MLKAFKLPIVRHLSAGVIILAVGFFIGWKIFKKKLDNSRQETAQIKGQYKQLKENFDAHTARIDTLQSVVVRLAEQEKIKVENHIQDTKVKDGAALSFVPTTTASIEESKKQIKTSKDSTETKPRKKRSWLGRIFRGKKNKN